MILSRRTRILLKHDWLRSKARLKAAFRPRRMLTPSSAFLHFGCGSRRIEGWLNVDVIGSEFDIDFAGKTLPWADRSFHCIVSQQVIEHFELRYELLPLLRELRRTLAEEGELWLSCPDMEKVCRSYVNDKGSFLFDDRIQRRPGWSERYKNGLPRQHIINEYFHQDAQHKNLYDYELLNWALEQAGFSRVRRTSEPELLKRFPEFPERNDDLQSLYVVVQR